MATTFREPARTWELALFVWGPEGPRSVGAATAFGKIFYSNYNGVERRGVEDAAEVSLAPGATHAFVEDVGMRWPHLFGPGVHNLQVINRTDAREIESNVISIHVRFTEASMPKLFDLAERSLGDYSPSNHSSEAAMVVSARRFAAEWIAYMQPGFQLDPNAAGPAAEEMNSAAVAEARALWAHHQGDPEVTERMDLVNRPASQAQSPRGGSN